MPSGQGIATGGERSRSSKYSDEYKADVLRVYQKNGLNETERRTGVSKKTILNWAREAGMVKERIAEDVALSHARERNLSIQRTMRERQEARERMVNRLVKVSEASLIRELEVLAAGGFSREDLQALTNARMKAIQQFELLEGRATARTDFGQEAMLHAVTVAFGKMMELVPGELRDLLSECFSTELRQARDDFEQGRVVELDDVEDAEFEVSPGGGADGGPAHDQELPSSEDQPQLPSGAVGVPVSVLAAAAAARREDERLRGTGS